MAKTAEIKKRIESIEMMGSITNAMYLVSMAKLQKHQKRIDTLKEYERLTKQHMAEIFAAFKYTDEAQNNPFMNKRQQTHNVAYVVFASSVGLCGSYNENIAKQVEQEIKQHPDETAYIYIVGTHGFTKLGHRGINVYKLIDPQSDILRYSELRETITNEVIDKFYQGVYDAIRIIYTEYQNPLVQQVKTEQLLPIPDMNELLDDAELNFAPYTLFEPSPEEVLEYMVRKHIKSTTYIHYLEAQTSEEAIRRMSMDNANKNGDELKEKLKLRYNRERQANITQEMTEIISGSSQK